MKTHSIYQASDLTMTKCLFLQNLFFFQAGKVQNHFVDRFIQVVSGQFYTMYTKKREKTNNVASCSAGFVEPVR